MQHCQDLSTNGTNVSTLSLYSKIYHFDHLLPNYIPKSKSFKRLTQNEN